MHIAYRRVRGTGFKRAWQLGFTLLAFDDLPLGVINLITGQIMRLTHSAALGYVEKPLAEGITAVFGMVVATVVWIEMRVRYDGSDIEAAIGRGDQISITNGGASSAPISSAGSE